MTRRIVFAPYALRVSATRELARMFDSFCILPEGSRFRPRQDDMIVNWGRSDLPPYDRGEVINTPTAVRMAVNKLDTFNLFRQFAVPTVEWTTSPLQAQEWLDDDEYVIARHRLSGRGGDGVEIVEVDPLPRAPLYTKYAKRKHEYRVHVCDGNVIDVQQKKRRNGAARTHESNMIRSYANGWVFCRENVNAPEAVLEAAVLAVGALGLHFGGVDIGWNAHYRRAYVYEVNSAPGIEGTTLTNYFNAIKELAA